MFIKKNYSVKDMVWWTRHDTVLLLIIALIPVVIYQVFDQKWLHLPWLPIAVVGTAVAFIISFQNNASYDRVWEARKIWGGIVNTSRSWGMTVNDFITGDFTDEDVSGAELSAIRKELVFRHIAWLTALRHAMRQPRPWEHVMKHPTNREWGEAIGVREHRHSLEEEITPYLSEADFSYFFRSRTSLPSWFLSSRNNYASCEPAASSKTSATWRWRTSSSSSTHFRASRSESRTSPTRGNTPL